MPDTLVEKSLLERFLAKEKTLDTKRQLSKDVLKKIKEVVKLERIDHSNVVEGNTLTLEETRVVLEHGITIRGKPLKHCLEALNTAQALDFVEKLVKSKVILTHETIQQIHKAVTKGILNKLNDSLNCLVK